MSNEHRIRDHVMKKDRGKFVQTRNQVQLIIAVIIPMIVTMIAAFFLGGMGKNIGIPGSHKVNETEKLYSYLTDAVESSKFTNEYFQIAFNHYDRLSGGKLTNYGIIETLEDFIVHLNLRTENLDTNAVIPVLEILIEARETQPFSALPAEERRLMNHLQTLLESGAQSEKVTQTMNELKQVMIARYKEYHRIEAQNSWSLPLAFVGIFFTIVFGIWTSVLTIKKSKMLNDNTNSESTSGRIL